MAARPFTAILGGSAPTTPVSTRNGGHIRRGLGQGVDRRRAGGSILAGEFGYASDKSAVVRSGHADAGSVRAASCAGPGGGGAPRSDLRALRGRDSLDLWPGAADRARHSSRLSVP